MSDSPLLLLSMYLSLPLELKYNFAFTLSGAINLAVTFDICNNNFEYLND